MTRKDFQLIADAVQEAMELIKQVEFHDAAKVPPSSLIPLSKLRAEVLSRYPAKESIRSVHILADSLAEKLATTNSQFDRERFLKACGIEE